MTVERVGTASPILFGAYADSSSPGTNDHTVPPAIAKASYRRQARNEGVTEYFSFPGGTALVIDSGWREVAEAALAFLQRFAR